MKFKYNELILSDSDTFIETLKDNTTKDLDVIITYNFFDENQCYDLALINKNISFSKDFFHKVKNIINLTGSTFKDEETKLTKPVKLTKLLNLILSLRKNKMIFSRIIGNWIYDEQLNLIFNEKDKIKITDRENLIFKFLLINQKNEVSKSFILESLFKDLPWVGVNNIEVYLNRLKSKLPSECYNLIR